MGLAVDTDTKITHDRLVSHSFLEIDKFVGAMPARSPAKKIQERVETMNFRPCIDLRHGRVVQIVGGTLRDGDRAVTHFETERSPADYARLYRADGL